MSEEETHAKTLRETIIWLNGATLFAPDRGLELPCIYRLRDAQHYFDAKVKNASDTRKPSPDDEGIRELAARGGAVGKEYPYEPLAQKDARSSPATRAKISKAMKAKWKEKRKAAAAKAPVKTARGRK